MRIKLLRPFAGLKYPEYGSSDGRETPIPPKPFIVGEGGINKKVAPLD
jgi:hypothetical protein